MFLCLIVPSCVSRLHVYIPSSVHLSVCMFFPCVFPSMYMSPSCVSPSVCMSFRCVSPPHICHLRMYVPSLCMFPRLCPRQLSHWDAGSGVYRLMSVSTSVESFGVHLFFCQLYPVCCASSLLLATVFYRPPPALT